MKNNKPVVAHIHHSFFVRSETFIYNYVSNLNHFHPICLAWEFANLDQFPFPEEDRYSISVKRYTFKGLWYGIPRRYLGRDLLTEKIIKKRNAKLIHAHFGPNGVYALKVRRALNIPLITTFYGYDISRLTKIKEWLKQYKILFKEGDLFLVEGQHMKSRLLDIGCSEEKIQIQRIAIPLEKINFKPRKPKKRDGRVILIFSGRFVEKKGLIYALQAIKEVRGRHKNFEFLIIGDGPLKPEIEEFIETNNMGDYVQMLGFLSYENYLKEMQKADIFIHPSVTASNGDSEGGAPTTILEAQAMGMPIISSYHADIPNITVPGKSALLSNERDWETLSRNIAYLLENQEVWEQMGIIGREFVETYHDINKEVNALEDKYTQLLQK